MQPHNSAPVPTRQHRPVCQVCWIRRDRSHEWGRQNGCRGCQKDRRLVAATPFPRVCTGFCPAPCTLESLFAAVFLCQSLQRFQPHVQEPRALVAAAPFLRVCRGQRSQTNHDPKNQQNPNQIAMDALSNMARDHRALRNILSKLEWDVVFEYMESTQAPTRTASMRFEIPTPGPSITWRARRPLRAQLRWCYKPI